MNENNVPPCERSLRRVPWNKGQVARCETAAQTDPRWSIRTKL
jgi:hypothetical protein